MRLVIFCHFIALLLASTSFAQAKKASSSSKNVEAKSRLFSNLKKKKALHKKLQARGYEVTKIPEYQIPPMLTREDLNKILPKDVTPQHSSDEVLKKMGDRAVQAWLKSSTMQSFSVVQTAQKVEQALKTEVAIGGSDDSGKPQHKFNFQVQAIQAVSKVDYTGFVDCTVSYNMRENKTGVEVREKIFKNKDLFVNHSTTKNEDLSSVGMRWSF